VKSIQNPSTALRWVATYASTPASTGPVQGAAMTPATRPIPNAPANPFPPTLVSFCWSAEGSAISNAPNMLAASANRKSASSTTTAGEERTEPKAFPESAAARPRTEYIAAMPPT